MKKIQLDFPHGTFSKGLNLVVTFKCWSVVILISLVANFKLVVLRYFISFEKYFLVNSSILR